MGLIIVLKLRGSMTTEHTAKEYVIVYLTNDGVMVVWGGTKNVGKIRLQMI
jgi:hypothetical protein